MTGDVTLGALARANKYSLPIGSQLGAIANASYSQASSTTFATVGGLKFPFVPVGSYIFDLYLATTNNGTGGLKLALNTDTSLTTSLFLADTWVYNTTTLTGEANQTTFGSSLIAAAIAATAVFAGGTLIVNKPGSLILQAAQDVSNGTAFTIANGSYITLNRVA